MTHHTAQALVLWIASGSAILGALFALVSTAQALLRLWRIDRGYARLEARMDAAIPAMVEELIRDFHRPNAK